MKKPTIHSNGTSAKDLTSNFCNIYEQVDELMKALREGMPHGRDYYPQGPQVINEAQQEFRDKLKFLEKMKEEIQTVVEDLLDESLAIRTGGAWAACDARKAAKKDSI